MGRLRRREFLGWAAGSRAAAGAVAAAPLAAAAPAAASAREDAAGPVPGLSFALVADTHVNLSNTVGQQWLSQVYRALARHGPAFVLHCGDVTDTGLDGEYALHAQILPASLAGRVRYVPGNHEVRWDGSAEELYHQHFGPAPYSFDAGGVHFIGFDPTQLLQEPGHYGAGYLSWLADDLRRAGPSTPSVLYQHYPMGDDFYYVDDQDRLFDLIAAHNVRGVFAGHIHQDQVRYMNGLSQVVLDAVKNGPMYYWAEIAAGAGVPVLQVSRVDVAADGSETRRAAATVWLAGEGPGGAQRPAAVHLGAVRDGRLPVAVEPGPAAPQSVSCHLYPQVVFGGTYSSSWLELTAPGAGSRRWTGAIDVSASPPGTQRLQLRSAGEYGAWWEDTVRFPVPAPAGTPEVVWEHRVEGRVQGALLYADGLVIAGSTAGTVTALRPDGEGRAGPQWQASSGPVYRGAAAGAGTVFVPSADHNLYALDSRSGRSRWAYRADAPVLSAPFVTQAGDSQAVVFSAGGQLLAVDAASGRLIWAADAGGFSAGRAATDGTRVFRGGGDGYARAFDAATGAPAWTAELAGGDEHHRLPYGPWDDTILVVDDADGGIVLVATVSAAWALDTATGAQRWAMPGNSMHPPSLLLGGDPPAILITTEFGVVTRADVGTGAVAWQTALGVRCLNSGAAIAGGTAWVQSTDGQLIGVDLATGTERSRLQHSLAYCFSTPVAVDGNLVATADQDGVIRGIRVP